MISLATAVVAASSLSWRAADAYLTGASVAGFRSEPLVHSLPRQPLRRHNSCSAAAAAGRTTIMHSLMSSSAPTCFDIRKSSSSSSEKDETRCDPQLLEGGSTSRMGFLRMVVSSTAAVACTAVVAAAGTSVNAVDGVVPSSGGEGVSSLAEEQLRPAILVAEEGVESTATSAFSGLVAGAAVSTSKQLLLHPVDTVKTRLQMRRDGSTGASPELFKNVYDGILPPLLVGAPSGALFFSAKDAFSTAIGNTFGGGYADLTTIAAVGLAQFPYWGLRTPAELLKTRSQAGVSTREGGSGMAAVKSIVADEGIRGLYTGYASNIAYAFPADAIKFLMYGALKRSAKKAKGGAKLGTVEAAVLGSGASLVAQGLTTPLDVVRTRIMTKSTGDQPYEGGVPGAIATIAREEGFTALLAGTTPRLARSILSGAIQFGSYEFVKGLFGVEPRKL